MAEKKASKSESMAAVPTPVDALGSSETLLAPAGAPKPAGGAPAPRTYTGPGPSDVVVSSVASETLLAPSRPSRMIATASDIATLPGRRTAGGSAASEVAPVSAQTAYAFGRPSLPPGTATDDPMVGKRIDHFEVRGRLGEGGMGAVYLAHDLSLERPVAIKVLRRELAADDHLIDRLIMEARAQARLQHPNVVTIYYIGARDGAPYFAMEYVRGKSLEDHLVEVGAIPWADALEYVIQTARALAAAYRRGIIHRDVKPSNLILATDRGGPKPEVMVADFGLATPVGGREGTFAGSPHYASPEQIAGHPLDHRSDIYALGITFYQLVTGERPFDATTLTDLFRKHQSAPRPPIPDDKAPWRLRRLIADMMEQDRSKRPPTYDDLIARLEALRPKEVMAGGMVVRGMALAADLIVLAILGQLLHAVLPLGQVGANQAGILLFGVYYVGSQARWRRTVGKHLFGLEVVTTKRGRLRWQQLLTRFLVEFWGPIVAVVMIGLQLGAATDLDAVKDQIQSRVGMAIPILDQSLEAVLKTVLVPNLFLALPWLGGFLFAPFDDQRRALHDRAAGTRVVYRHKR